MYSDFRRTIFQKRRPRLAYGRATGGRCNCLLQYRRSGVSECRVRRGWIIPPSQRLWNAAISSRRNGKHWWRKPARWSLKCCQCGQANMNNETKIYITAETGGVVSGVEKAKQSIKSLGDVASSQGRRISDGLVHSGDGAEKSSTVVSAASKRTERSLATLENAIRRDIAVKIAGGNANREYYDCPNWTDIIRRPIALRSLSSSSITPYGKPRHKLPTSLPSLQAGKARF